MPHPNAFLEKLARSSLRLNKGLMVLGALVLLPASLWLGQSWVETALLAGSVVIVMIVELLNTGIETAIDRIGPEWHDLSKRAKDMGSAAVLLALLLCAGIWGAAVFQRIFHG